MTTVASADRGGVVKERPILFSAPMVRAILAGTKTQTRRIVKANLGREIIDAQPFMDDPTDWMFMEPGHTHGTATVGPATIVRCPYGKTGDRLWVRETWGLAFGVGCAGIAYRADNVGDEWDVKLDELQNGHWRPSIHMPREHSRITLEITDVRVQRLQEISMDDCRAEGCNGESNSMQDPYSEYSALWESINGTGSWDANPWVWALTFKRIKPAPSPAPDTGA